MGLINMKGINMESINNSQYLSFTDSESLYGSTEKCPLIKINTPFCNAVIAPQGAQLLEFTPKNEDKESEQSWLWLSPKAIFSEGKAIRGGIPVCAPWFGVNQQAPQKPKHGFVRTQQWALNNIVESENGVVELLFQFTSSESDLPLYPHYFQLDLKIILSDHIKMSLSVHNLSDSIMPFSWALHSYFCVDKLQDVHVQGLDKHQYLDAANRDTAGNFSVKHQQGDIYFKGEVDSVYECVGKQQTIIGTPAINIEGEGCPTAIVWNPGAELAKQMSDVGIEHYEDYICVERGAAFNDSWSIAPGSSKSATLLLSKQ